MDIFETIFDHLFAAISYLAFALVETIKHIDFDIQFISAGLSLLLLFM